MYVYAFIYINIYMYIHIGPRGLHYGVKPLSDVLQVLAGGLALPRARTHEDSSQKKKYGKSKWHMD